METWPCRELKSACVADLDVIYFILTSAIQSSRSLDSRNHLEHFGESSIRYTMFAILGSKVDEAITFQTCNDYLNTNRVL